MKYYIKLYAYMTPSYINKTERFSARLEHYTRYLSGTANLASGPFIAVHPYMIYENFYFGPKF